MRHDSAHLATILREPSRGIASLPWALCLVVDGVGLRSALRSSLEGELAPGQASGEVRPAIARALSPSPLPRGGVLVRGPPHAPGRRMMRKTCSSVLGSTAPPAKGSSGGRLMQ